MTKKPSNPMPVLTIPKLSEGQLEPLFRRLNLAHTRRIYLEVADRAEKENWTYRDFLALLLAEEVAHRKQTRLQRCTRQAHFPFFKTIDEFDFTLQSTLRQSLLGSYLGPDFVTEGRSLILYGKAGRGKTHLAVAIGYRAIQNGFDTVCTTAAKLIEDLSNASAKGLLQQSLPTYTRPHVLVIDEIGYLSYGPDAANVLFHVVNDRHLRKRPMIFTTNKPLSEWGKVLHDEDLAAAILDRVLERGRFLPLDGPSGRTRHLNLEEVSPSKAERLRISGINGSEFPEPTPGAVPNAKAANSLYRHTQSLRFSSLAFRILLKIEPPFGGSLTKLFPKFSGCSGEHKPCVPFCLQDTRMPSNAMLGHYLVFGIWGIWGVPTSRKGRARNGAPKSN
jgi:DNA replication protein DnaC